MYTVSIRVYSDSSNDMLCYPIGQQVTVNIATELAGVASDPEEVTLQVREGNGSNRTYKYSLSQITKTATGNYQKILNLTKAGQWQLKANVSGNSGGTRGVSGDVVITVDPSTFSLV